MRKAERVANVSPWTVGGSGTWRDAVTLPPWLFLLGKFVWFWICHPVHAVVVVALVWLYLKVGLLLTVLVLVGLLLLGASGWVAWAGQGCSPASPRNLLRGTMRLLRFRRLWLDCCEAAGVLSRRSYQPVPVSRVRITDTGLTFKAECGRVGRTVDELSVGAQAICAVLGATSCSVDMQGHPGRATVSLAWGDPTMQVLTVADLPDSLPGYASFGRDGAGAPVSLALHTSTLIVGESGSGKSNLIWALIAALNKQGIPYRLRVVDPAGGVEMSRLEGAAVTRSYTDRIKDADAFVEQARDAMYARLNAMKKAGERKVVISKDNPLDILVIDEILLLGDLLKKGASSHLGEILSVGRKAGYIVWGLSQLSQVDALGRVRDLFPQRICLATKSREMTDAVLGPGAEGEGAKCTRIPKDQPGVGYMFVDKMRGFKRFRAAYIPDEYCDIIAEGGFPEVLPKPVSQTKLELADRKTALYRLYSDDGRLLYVGITVNPNIRFQEHAEDKPWWSEVQLSRTRIVWFDTRSQALAAEKKAIREEHPVFNVAEVISGEATG